LVKTLTTLVGCILLVPRLGAQANRPFVEVGAGTLAPNDPFVVTLALRASAGWVLGGQNAVTIDYTRQSAPKGHSGNDLGKYARSFLGIAWQHALHDVFSDPEPETLQYLVRLSGGTILRGTFPEAVKDQKLRNAPFVGLGLVIQYPLSSRVAAVGSVEDAIGFLPAETVQSYCSDQTGYTLCYPQGGPDYYTIDLPNKTQHNLGVVLTMQFRL
jgi:hypothetical protein